MKFKLGPKDNQEIIGLVDMECPCSRKYQKGEKTMQTNFLVSFLLTFGYPKQFDDLN